MIVFYIVTYICNLSTKCSFWNWETKKISANLHPHLQWGIKPTYICLWKFRQHLTNVIACFLIFRQWVILCINWWTLEYLIESLSEKLLHLRRSFHLTSWAYNKCIKNSWFGTVSSATFAPEVLICSLWCLRAIHTVCNGKSHIVKGSFSAGKYSIKSTRHNYLIQQPLS